LDKQIEQPWLQKHQWKLISAGGLLMVICLIIWLAIPRGVVLSSETLRFGEVRFGDFQEIIVANGTVEPEKSVLIDAKEGGTILEIKTEEGQIVKAGDVLVTLQNESLILDYMQRETQIVEQINNLRNTRIALEQNIRSVQDQLDDVVKTTAGAQRKFISDSSLYATNGIARNDYMTSRDEYEYLSRRTATFAKRLQQDRRYQQVQFKRIDASIALMERNLEMIRSTIDEMSVKAPLGGQLNAFDLEVGQVLQRNASIGRIDVPGKFKIRALVDQHYLNRVATGQLATIEYEKKLFELQIDKVQTLVENGQFEVMLSFTDSIPEGIRRGQSFQVKIMISAQTKANMIPRGPHYQTSGGNYVYVVSEDGTYATKRAVSIGKQNPDYYEVTDGLEEGEQIIISSYDHFKDEDRITIEQTDK